MRTGHGLAADADWLWTGHGHGLAVDLNLDVLCGHGASIARLFCGHFADTESFTDEGVGRALG
jgi:hypothetical protein